MSRKQPPFFTFSISHQTYTTNFTLDYHSSITPEDITHDDDQLSMKPIRQKRLEIMKMMVSEDITHDDDQLSTEPIRWKRLEIMKMKVSWKQKKILRKKRVYSKTTCVIFYI